MILKIEYTNNTLLVLEARRQSSVFGERGRGHKEFWDAYFVN